MFERDMLVEDYLPPRTVRGESQRLVRLQGVDLMALPALWNDLVALRALENLNLGVYRIGQEHRIGFNAGAWHPHDRWLYKASSKENWVRVPVEGDSAANPKVVNLRGDLDTLRQMCEFFRVLTKNYGKAKPGAMLEIVRALGENFGVHRHLLEYMDSVPLNISGDTLHGLLHHYPRWQAVNPEFKDMPQELALRMHGLGGLLDAGYQLA